MKRYDYQQAANEMSLFTSHKFVDKTAILKKLCTELATKNVRWAVSMSLSLFLRGIHDHFNDFDLLIAPEDVPAFEEVFESLGGKINHNTIQKAAFTSPYYKEAEMDGVPFDLIGDITIETYGTVYRYELEEIEWFTLRQDLNIPTCPIEAQYILYYMMQAWESRRIFKTNLCEQYLKDVGVKYPEVFKRALVGTELYSKKYGRANNWQLPNELSNNILIMMSQS